MKEAFWFTAVAGLLLFYVGFMGHSIGYSSGKVDGRAEQIEMEKRIKCEVEYEKTPVSLVPAECVKYF